MKYLWLLFLLGMFEACKGNRLQENTNAFYSDTIRKDIPKSDDGVPCGAYLFKNKFEGRLGLANIERGVDSLEIRISFPAE